MKSKLTLSILSLGMLLASTTPRFATAERAWSDKMRHLSRILPEILVDVTSDQRFFDPKNEKRLLSNTKDLASLAHGMTKQQTGSSKSVGPIDTDPSILLISEMFDQEVGRAYTALKEGNKSYARSTLKAVTSYCIACHSRTEFGPQFPTLDIKWDTSTLSPFEKAALYAAVRQFDRALNEYDALVADSSAQQTRPIEWERAVKKALAIAVRVNEDIEKATKIASHVVTSPNVAAYFKDEAFAWQQSLAKWKKEQKRDKKSVPGYFAEAKLLVSQGRAAQKYPADASGDIYYLRATRVLHDVMRMQLGTPQLAEALFLSGVCYEALDGMGLWGLPEAYYEACIRKTPHSALGLDCFRRYEKNVFLGFSGSGGFALPDDVKKHLDQLRNLSAPEAPIKGQK